MRWHNNSKDRHSSGAAMVPIRLLLVTACIPCLAACSVTQQRDKMSAALDPYVGKSVANYIAARGEPTSSVKLADRESAFRWVITGQGAGGVVPIGGSLVVVPPRQLVCTVIFTATTTSPSPEFKDWIVTSYRWDGAC